MAKDIRHIIYQTKIIESCDRRKEIAPSDDGFMYYWPVGSGYLSATDLRIIADELDRRNEVWNKQINDYFEPKGGIT